MGSYKVKTLHKEKSFSFSRIGPDIYGSTHPQNLLSEIKERAEFLYELLDRHVISIDPFSKDCLLQLFRLAAKFESNPNRYISHNSPLKGKILINAFYEPSTRTRLSFDSAWHRLGGDSINITDKSSTGIAKGESHLDIAHMFNNYGDCVVLRESDNEAIFEMTKSLRIPIINAGNGIDEHPTQAMADLYTIFKWRPHLVNKSIDDSEKITIGIIGVPSRMRTVRSLLKLFCKFSYFIKKIIVIYDHKSIDQNDLFDEGQLEQLIESGLKIELETDMQKVLPSLDVTYINAIAWVGENYEVHGSSFKLHSELPFKKDSIILHPLARGPELSTSLDQTSKNWYFAQSRGAVFVRMALLTCLMDRTTRVMDVV